MLAHEIITGLRPFFHYNVPTTLTIKGWIDLIAKKPHETIAIEFIGNHDEVLLQNTSNESNEKQNCSLEDVLKNTTKDLEHHNALNCYNQLSKSLRNDFTQWLQMLLEIDPQKRGYISSGYKHNKHEEEHEEVFATLNNIMCKTRVKLNLMNLTYLDIVISDSSRPTYYNNLQTFKNAIENVSGIRIQDMLTLTSSGKTLNTNEDFSTFVSDIKEGKEADLVYVYDVKFNNKSRTTVQPKINKSMLTMLKNPKQEISYESKLVLAGKIYCFMREEIYAMECLNDANNIFVKHLLQLGIIQKFLSPIKKTLIYLFYSIWGKRKITHMGFDNNVEIFLNSFLRHDRRFRKTRRY